MLTFKNRFLVGIGLVSLAALALEIVFTRLFSVTLWYHFAFFAISAALLGSAAAGLWLYFVPRLTQPATVERALHAAALALAVAAPLACILYLQIPLQVTLGRRDLPVQQVFWLAVVVLDLTLPFFLAGLALALALAAWPGHIGRLYWADLSGAALGCLVSILALQWLGGVGAVFLVGLVAAAAALVFGAGSAARRYASLGVGVVLLGALVGNARFNWITLSVSKSGGPEPTPVYERWNVHSRVTVYAEEHFPFFWSVAPHKWEDVIASGRYLNHALLLIDSVAGTPIQQFRGELWEVDFLRYDLSSFVYHLVPNPYALVIGPGGGRDVLAALASGAPEVTAVEVNPAIVEAMRGPFAEFSGGLYARPDVRVVVDDARGYIERETDLYDVIQASLIDTWAAGGSGAFALSENSLYTREAFRAYFAHLTERGMLTISRWYLDDRPAETLRLLATGLAAWDEATGGQAAQHVAVVARTDPATSTEGMSTALFKRTPFTPAEVDALTAAADDLGFTVLYAPGLPVHEAVGQFITAPDRAAWIARYPLDISPATDDRPFFFNIVRFGDLMDPALSGSGVYRTSMEAIQLLALIILLVAGLGVLGILLPLGLGARRGRLARPSAAMLGYFAAIGLAFMLVEIPTIQALTLYLGRPVYSLAVVLFSLLVFSALGSLWSGRRAAAGARPRPGRLFAALAVLVVLHAAGGAWLLHATLAQPLALRLVIAVLLLAVLGVLMGMPFPTGMHWAAQRPGAEAAPGGVVPWLWGLNGLMSVMGSSLAIAAAIHVGLQATLFAAAGVYALAGVLLALDLRRAPLTA